MRALAAHALLDAYRGEAPEISVDPLDLSVFSADIAGSLNWTRTRINIALHADDPTRRAVAAREIPELLANPPARSRFEQILQLVSE